MDSEEEEKENGGSRWMTGSFVWEDLGDTSLGLLEIIRETWRTHTIKWRQWENNTAYFEVTVAAPGIAACYWLPGVTGSPDHMALKLFCGQETSAFHTYTNAQVTCWAIIPSGAKLSSQSLRNFVCRATFQFCGLHPCPYDSDKASKSWIRTKSDPNPLASCIPLLAP